MKYRTCFLFLFSFIFSSFAQLKVPTLTVLWFENRSPDRTLNYLSELLPERISAELSKSNRFILVEREDIRHALEEICLSEEGFTSNEEKIGKGLVTTADYIVSGCFTKEDDKLIITLTIFNRESGSKKAKDFTCRIDGIETLEEDVKLFLIKEIQEAGRKEKKKSDISPDEEVILFLDAKNRYFRFEDSAYNDIVDSFPFARIIGEEIERLLENSGLECVFVSKKEEIDLLDKNIQVFEIIVPPIGPNIYRNGLNSIVEVTLREWKETEKVFDLTKIKRKTFACPLNNLEGLSRNAAVYILGNFNREFIISEESSPKIESLLYYWSYLQQRLYQDFQSALKEIYKSLYLYPDFLFYRYALGEAYQRMGQSEKTRSIYRLFLRIAEWDDFYCMYENIIWAYIYNCGHYNAFSCKRDSFLIPILENIVEKRTLNNWRTKHMAIVLSRLYLCNRSESEYQRLKDKGFISDEEFYGNLSLLYLFEKLGFTKEEKEYLLNSLLDHLTDFEMYKNMFFMYLPETISRRYRKNREEQIAFLSLMNNLVKKYPQARTNFFIFFHTTRYFEQDIVTAELERMEKEIPDSYLAYYQKVKKLEQNFLCGTADKSATSKIIADIAFGPLGNIELLNEKWMPMNFLMESVKEKIAEDDLLILFSEFFRRAGTAEKAKIMNIMPEHLRTRFLDADNKTERTVKTNNETRVSVKSAFKALISPDFDYMAEDILQCGGDVDFFSKQITNFDEYRFILLRLDDNNLMYYDETSKDRILKTDILNNILQSKSKPIFILIIPHGTVAIEPLNKFLSQFNCYVDEKKCITSRAVFLPGKLKDAFEYHCTVYKTANILFAQGYPIYYEKGNSIVKSSEGDYDLAISLPVTNGKFVITCDLNIRRPNLFKYNIFRIMLSDISDRKILPISFIREVEEWNKIPIPRNLQSPISGMGADNAFYAYVEPLKLWIDEKERPSPYPTEALARDLSAFKVQYENILKQIGDDKYVSAYIESLYLERAGISNIYLGKTREGIEHLQKLRELFDKKGDSYNKDRLSIMIVYIILNEKQREPDYNFCYSTLKTITEKSWLVMAYDLEGRLKEREGKYSEAVAAYEKMLGFLILDTSFSTSKQYLSYALFRQASILFSSGNFKKAEEVFINLINALSRDWDLKPKTVASYEFFTFTRCCMYGITPVPFSMKISSYLYLKEINRSMDKDFIYLREVENLLKYAEENHKNNRELQEIVCQIKRIL